MLNTGVSAHWPGQRGNSHETIMRGGIILPMNSRWAQMDNGFIMSLTGEQQHLITADLLLQFNLRITQPLSEDPKGCMIYSCGTGIRKVRTFAPHPVPVTVALEGPFKETHTSSCMNPHLLVWSTTSDAALSPVLVRSYLLTNCNH